MDISKFRPDSPGQLVEINASNLATYAFIPAPLPPEWVWPERLWPLLMRAREELARLDGVGRHLPNSQLLLTPMRNREAQRSSSMEGTNATPEQMALFEMSPTDSMLEQEAQEAVEEVANYARAANFWNGAQTQLPISLRLIRTLHKILLDGVRGANKTPGEFRRGQVQVGSNARYVPPPANSLPDVLDQFEKYLHQPSKYDPLVNAFLAHYQFEAIHPFGDGNGRVGRLLLAITIQEWCGLSGQWLYMSAYFDRYKDEYIDRLFGISVKGDWEGWVEFCLNGVVSQALDTQKRCERLLKLRDEYKNRLIDANAHARLFHVVDNLFTHPVATATSIMEDFHVTHPTARVTLDALVHFNILNEVALKQRRQKGYYCSDIFSITYDDV